MRDLLQTSAPAPTPLEKYRPRTVAVFRALQLGDLLVSVPAFRALRAALPKARITLIGLPWARSFVDRFSSYFDDFVEFPGYPGLPEQVPGIIHIPAFFSEMQTRCYDLAIQMHGCGSFVNPVCMLFGAKRTAGFFVKGEYCPDSELFMPYPEQETEIWRNLRLMQFLGAKLSGSHLEFPITFEDRKDLMLLKDMYGLSAGEYACIHPGSRLASRRWLPERFAQIADHLAEEGLKVVLTGSKDEIDLTRRVAGLMRRPPVNLAGKTGLGTLAALISDARLLVCNDTGVSHIADALSVPSVIIVTGSDINRWQPQRRTLHATVFSQISCRPCQFNDCPIGHPCAVNVKTESVLERVTELLSREPRYSYIT